MGHVFNYNLPLYKIDGVDTSQDTVTPDDLLEGVTAHDADGNQITGTHVCEGGDGGVDTSNDTVTPNRMLAGVTAHDASGKQIIGTIESYNGYDYSTPYEMTSTAVRFQTKGKYVLNEIAVVPKLQEKTSTTGEIVTADVGYVGLKSVDTTPVFEAGYKQGKDEGGGGSDEPLIIDCSGKKNLRRLFADSNVKRVKTVDARDAISAWNGMADMFISSKIEEVQEFYPSIDTGFSGTFSYCFLLKRVIFKSKIATNGLSIPNSRSLDRESIESVFSNLSDTTSGLSVTFNKTAVDNAFETSEGSADGSTSDEWIALMATRPNWSISLIDA